MPDPIIQILKDPDEVAHAAAERVVAAINEAIEQRGLFSIALSGGTTPKRLYQLLSAEPYRSQVEWPRVHFYFGDERTVPPDHMDSNFRMAREHLISKVRIPRENIHRIRGEIDPNAAATEYGKMLKEEFGDGGMDLILLGMGDDGHTASLFPQTAALKESEHRCVANHVPKLNTWRVTLSAMFINRARLILILVTGATKADVVARAIKGPRDPENLPVQLIAPSDGQLVWLLDEAAAAGVK